ncbi:hypothetical protein BC835DRAFT_1421121 [Cytidiella melzeri]|nr:hypothetical protein BC835DRAFT_1421121 [Cytidiella melzeri]
MSTAHFTPYSYKLGLNDETVIVLDELGLTHKKDHKAEEYAKLNPNGRLPTLIDHKNSDPIVWESDAIILYLVDTCDTEHKISVWDTKEKYSGFSSKLLDRVPTSDEPPGSP